MCLKEESLNYHSTNYRISSAKQFVRCWKNDGEKKMGRIFVLLEKMRLVLDLLNLALR